MLRLTMILAAAIPLFAQSDVTLQRAIRKETVEGDLKGAIELYRKAAAEAGKDRTTGAQALLHLAQCYEKQGNAEARAIYERLVREYGDQKDAVATARARLGGRESAGTAKGDRPVWTGSEVDMFGTISPDGRSLTYVDWNAGNLMLRDLVARTARPLVKNVPGRAGWAGWSAISRDGKHVAYYWTTSLNGKKRHELRITALGTADSSESREVISLDDEHFRGIHPFDWSPDGAWLAVSFARRDSTGQIGLVSVQDGVIRMLKSTGWLGAGKIVFSPDGRYIAYDLPIDDTSEQRNVFTLATDGSQEATVVAHASRNVVMGWLNDERKHLLFASDRTGTMSLWAVPVSQGKPHSAPRLIKSGIGSSTSLGLTASGALSVYKPATGFYLQVASIDLDVGKLTISPGSFQRFGGVYPSWSPDGKYLAYGSCAPEGPCALSIASHDTGEVRQLRPKMSYLGSPQWSSDGQSFITDGSDAKDRRGLYRINAQSGDVSPIMVPRPGQVPRLDRTEKKIYYRQDGNIVELDLASGSKRDVFRRRAEGYGISIIVSPDSRSVAAVEDDTKGNATMLVIPTAGGEPRELWKVEKPESIAGYVLTWTPDSRAILVIKQVSGRQELWYVPVTEGRPRKLDIDVENWEFFPSSFTLHPDGRRIAFVASAGKQGPEVWMLENILSSLSSK